jgi:hypothetical protein
MKTTDRIYEGTLLAAIEAARPEAKEKLTRTDCELLSYAGECDRIARKLGDDMREMGDRFLRAAEELRHPLSCSSKFVKTPMGYSTTSDIAENATKLEAKRDAFAIMLRAVYGEPFLTAFLKAVREFDLAS